MKLERPKIVCVYCVSNHYKDVSKPKNGETSLEVISQIYELPLGSAKTWPHVVFVSSCNHGHMAKSDVTYEKNLFHIFDVGHNCKHAIVLNQINRGWVTL